MKAERKSSAFFLFYLFGKIVVDYLVKWRFIYCYACICDDLYKLVKMLLFAGRLGFPGIDFLVVFNDLLN